MKLRRADRDLDVIAIGILEEGRIGARGGTAGGAGLADAGAAGALTGLPGRLDGCDPVGGEADLAEAGLGPAARGDVEGGLCDPPADNAVLVVVAAPAQGREQRVIESGAALQVIRLED